MNKSIHFKNTSRIAVVLLLLLVMACDKNEEELSLSRQFSPTKITSVNGETQVTLTWAASLFTLPGEVTYSVEISEKADDFTTPVYATTSSDVSVVVTDEKLAIKKDYYARVKAMGKEDTGDSNWLVSSSFRILGEQFLLAVTTENVIDKSVRLSWRASNELTKIVITPANGTPLEMALTDADRSATLKQIGNLTPGTTYSAEIFAGAKSKGTQLFTTKPALTGNVIDLRGISVALKPNILIDTLPDIPSGSIVLLKRGSRYNVTAVYNFNKSVTIQSGLDFGTDLATIGLSTNFNLAAGTIDSLVFKDLVIKGVRASLGSYNSDYILNGNTVATVGKVKLEGCTIKILRGIVRIQTGGGGAKITNYLVNNCVMDSIREYGVAAANGTSAFANIKITNSTLSRARRFIVHTVAGSSSLAIENCTFNEVPAGALAAANSFIDYASFNIGTATMKNSIIGKVWDETGAGTAVFGIKAGSSTSLVVTNTYNTSDFVNTTNPLPGLSGYNGTAAALFTDPNNDNFKIKDANFIGKGSAGDPRWR
ncbi:MAG: DUF5123 domain-containing protein [Azospira oryzae]|nr:MAG: DUF5123 domain-containing protein [Azospira oryzae]